MTFKIIYADPAWTYRDKAVAGSRGVGFKYDLMDVDAIKRLPVAEIAALDCALFLWATFPLLPDALEVLNAWGFHYKTAAFVWEKVSSRNGKLHWGMGSWTRANAEVCLLGVRGKPKRINAGVHQIVRTAVRDHSRKPDEVRNRIVQLMGDLSRVELFAREKTEGWAAVGRSIDGMDIVASIKALAAVC